MTARSIGARRKGEQRDLFERRDTQVADQRLRAVIVAHRRADEEVFGAVAVEQPRIGDLFAADIDTHPIAIDRDRDVHRTVDIAVKRGLEEMRHACGAARDRAVAREIQLDRGDRAVRSEEHTSELQSLMRNSYAVFCLKKKKKQTHKTQ